MKASQKTSLDSLMKVAGFKKFSTEFDTVLRIACAYSDCTEETLNLGVESDLGMFRVWFD